MVPSSLCYHGELLTLRTEKMDLPGSHAISCQYVQALVPGQGAVEGVYTITVINMIIRSPIQATFPTFLDRSCGGNKGGEVLRSTVQYRERRDPGGPNILYNF